MKIFWHYVGVWFLAQLVIMSFVWNMNLIREHRGELSGSCPDDTPSLIAGVIAAAFPLSQLNITRGSFCWENFGTD